MIFYYLFHVSSILKFMPPPGCILSRNQEITKRVLTRKNTVLVSLNNNNNKIISNYLGRLLDVNWFSNINIDRRTNVSNETFAENEHCIQLTLSAIQLLLLLL